jgi:chromosome segregation ATPase
MSDYASNTEVAPEIQSDAQHGASPAETADYADSSILGVSAHDFSALEERVLRAVEVVRRERQARAAAEERAVQAEERTTQAEERATQAEAQSLDHGSIIEQHEKDLSALRAERDQVRQRVERLLGQLDALEL